MTKSGHTIQVVQEIGTSVEFVEKRAPYTSLASSERACLLGVLTEAEAAVQELRRSHEGTAEDILQPRQTLHRVSLLSSPHSNSSIAPSYRIRNGDAKQNHQMRNGLAP